MHSASLPCWMMGMKTANSRLAFALCCSWFLSQAVKIKSKGTQSKMAGFWKRPNLGKQKGRESKAGQFLKWDPHSTESHIVPHELIPYSYTVAIYFNSSLLFRLILTTLWFLVVSSSSWNCIILLSCCYSGLLLGF